MLQDKTAWALEKLSILLQRWPEDQSLRLGAGLIACILICGQLARMAMQLPLQSLQGRIALAHLVFFVGSAGLVISLMSMRWQPAEFSLLVIAILALPFYAIGRLTEKAEAVVREAIQDERNERGMRARVLEEIRQKKIDVALFDEAQARADGDDKKTRHFYIGLRSRKLARLLKDRSRLDPSSPEYGRVEFELTDDIVAKTQSFRDQLEKDRT